MAQKQRRSCFIISPIGPEGSSVRSTADDFLEVLVTPALARYDFDVVRADRIAHPTAITSDIIRLVQESDLCIIDLTSNNPNVFYECGRRHETGKPFIQMVCKGSEAALPFDVAGIRTVPYDLATPRSVLESQRKLQEFIDALVAKGFQGAASGESLSSLAQAIERVERKVNAILGTPGHGMASAGSTDEDQDEGDFYESLLASPRDQYIKALKRGQYERGLQILGRLKKTVSHAEYVAALGLLVSAGDAKAFELMDQEVEHILAAPGAIPEEGTILKVIAQTLHSYAVNTGELQRGLENMERLLMRVVSCDEISKDTKAFFANKVGMLAWIADEIDRCISSTIVAAELEPTEPSYLYNLALAYRRKKMEPELAQTLKRMAVLPDLDADHRRMLREHGIQVAD